MIVLQSVIIGARAKNRWLKRIQRVGSFAQNSEMLPNHAGSL